MFDDKQRFWKIFSGEKIPTWVSCGGQIRGCRVGKLLFPISQDWQHQQTLAPFSCRRWRSGAARLQMPIKNVLVLLSLLFVRCILLSFWPLPTAQVWWQPGVSSLWSLLWHWPGQKCRCQHSNERVTRGWAATPWPAATLWLLRDKNPLGGSVWQSRAEGRTHCHQRAQRDDLHLRRLFGNIPFCGALAARGVGNQLF